MSTAIYLLSVTAALSADQKTCDLHLRWSDGAEDRVNQDDVLAVYTASATHRRAVQSRPEPLDLYPSSNSQPWCAYLLDYADAYDKANAAPPAGYNAPSDEPEEQSQVVAPASVAAAEADEAVEPPVSTPAEAPVVQGQLFPSGGAGVEVATDPVIIRRRVLEVMSPADYKAAAKAAGIVGFGRMKKADLIDAVLKAEFDKPAPRTAEPESAAAPAEVEPAPEKKGRRLTKAQVAAAAKASAEATPPASTPSEPHTVIPAEPAPEAKPKRVRKAKTAQPAEPAGGIVAQDEGTAPGERPASAPEASGTILDGETRPEVAGEGLGGSGVELGGGLGLGGGTELGGGLGTGEGELSGGLTGESVGGIGGTGRDNTPPVVPKRPGAGCKQPDKVDGWEPGRVLVVVKPHRGEFKGWGTCEYRVRCDDDGGYTLLKLTGNRKQSDAGALYEGKRWAYVSQMLTDLMGIPRDPETGRPAYHHRMTLRRWFALDRAE